MFNVLPAQAAEFLAPLPIRRLPGVGHRTEKAQHRYNVKTIGELSRIPRALLARTFSNAAGRLLFYRSRGIDEEPVKPGCGPRSVSRETSFDPETADYDVIEGLFENPMAPGIALLVTGVVLWSSRGPIQRAALARPSWTAALAIGFAQAFALVPGISRSGSTVVAALWLLSRPLLPCSAGPARCGRTTAPTGHSDSRSGSPPARPIS